MSDGMSDEAWEMHDGMTVEHIEIDAHYSKLVIQPIEYSMNNGLDPMQHTIIKYVTRFRDKNGKRDLLAARHTIDMLIEYEYPDKV